MQYKEHFLKYLKFEKRSSEHTITSYCCDLEQFDSFLEENQWSDLSQITAKNIRRWMVSMVDTGLSTRSVNRKISTVKSFFRFLMREGIVEENPVLRVETPKIPKKLPVFVRESEMDSLLDDIPFGNDYEGVRDKLIMDMLYASGMRLSEMVNLTMNSIDLPGGYIKVLGKRNKERIIPIATPLKMQIIEYIKLRKSAFEEVIDESFLLTGKGKKIYPKLVYRIVKKYLNLVTTIHKKSPHVIRHTFATALLNAGADLNAIKELLGHANLNATQIYTHSSFEKITEIYNQAHPKGEAKKKEDAYEH